MPLILTTDFGSAFPSIIQQWMLIVFNACKTSRGFIHLISAIHADVSAFARISSVLMHIFDLNSGVIQGCPLASLCFVVAFDPFLNMMSGRLDEIAAGVCRACADDVGMVLVDIIHLLPICTIFQALPVAR
eukprot:14563791-Heterocapsa_arctica.AAC.1